jgi:hypothetical protein
LLQWAVTCGLAAIALLIGLLIASLTVGYDVKLPAP